MISRRSIGLPGRARTAGFTLAELLLTISVLAILTALAAPSFNRFVQNNRLAGLGNEMVTALQFARSEALKRGTTVRVCSSADGVSCGGTWNQGFIALADPDPSGGELLRVWTAPGNEIQFTPGSGQVDFLGNGFAAAPLNVTLESDFCPPSSENARLITVERTGRAASEAELCP